MKLYFFVENKIIFIRDINKGLYLGQEAEVEENLVFRVEEYFVY